MEKHLPWNHCRRASSCQTPLLTSSSWALHAQQEKHVWLLSALYPYSQTEISAWDVQGLSMYIEIKGTAFSPSPDFDPLPDLHATPQGRHLGLIPIPVHKLRNNQKAIPTWSHDKRILSPIYASPPQRTPGSAEGIKNIFFCFSNSNLKPDIILTYSIIPDGTFSWNM